jgi:MraZ protein
MTMLLGEFRCEADEEGRMMLPAGFSAELAMGATVTRGIERCLLVYPADEWEKLSGELRERLPFTSQAARAFGRFLFSAAASCEPGEEGRVVLPRQLLRYAGIDGEAIVIGLLTHLEVWHPDRWEKAKSTLVEEGPVLADQLRELGI